MADLFSNPNDLALASLGLRLMSTPGKFGPAIGTAGLGALNDLQQAQAITRQRQLQDELLKERQEELRRKRAAEDAAAMRATQMDSAYRGAFVSPREQALGANAAGPTVGNLQAMQQARPKFDRDRLIESLMKVPGGAELAAKLAQPEPDDVVSLAPGATAYSRRDNKALFTAPGTEPKNPAAVQEYEYARSQGYHGTFEQWELNRRKAGATNIGLPKIDIKVGEGLAKEIGPMVAASYEAAATAAPSIENSNRIISAIDSGKVIAGPFATHRMRLLQLADVIGVGGASSEEKLAKTRQVIQGLAQSTVNARGALKGQGQVSDYEGRLLEKASSGNIEDMTTGEIKQIAALNKRLSQQVIARHKTLMERARKQPGLTGLADMFDAPDIVDAPPGTGFDDAEKERRYQEWKRSQKP